MTTMTGRAAFNVRHHAHGRGAASSHNAGNRSDRRGLLREAMRDLDDATADFFASQNPSIVREETHLNVAAVNDGGGGFRRPDSIDEVLDYGDARSAKVKRKIQPKQSTISTFVVFLPRTMCDEIPDFYDGDPPRPRMVARDREEAIRYFEEVVAFLSDEVLTGGQAAIHGYDINFDETTPHIQIVADNFGPDGRGNLRADFSRIWTRHRDVTDDAGRVLSGSEKLRGYQERLRERMHGLGYDVELETSDRSTEELDKESFQRLRDGERKVEAGLAKIADLKAKVGKWYKGAKAELDAREEAVADLEEAVDAREEAVMKMERTAKRRGYNAGREEGLREAHADAGDIRAAARVDAGEICNNAHAEAVRIRRAAEEDANSRIKCAARAIEAERARARQEAIPAYDPVAVTDRMQADLVSVLGKMTYRGRPLLEVAHERAKERFRQFGMPDYSAETVAERRDRIQRWLNESPPPSAPESPDWQFGL